uniref:RBR-type E3 ubiquitin transferase n=1 Tax=Schistocephalus solidus TaxID=70667 RepID=A0A0V0J428_SCHSO
MDILDNIFLNGQRRQRSPSSATANNSSIRHKWAPHRKRTKGAKQGSEEEVELVGFKRIQNAEVCPICTCDSDVIYALRRCHHQACLYCWRSFANSQVNSFALAHVTCIACDRQLPPALVLSLLKPIPDSRLPSPTTLESFANYNSFQNDRIYQRYEDFLLHKCLLKDKHARWCPRGCGYAVLAHGFSACPRLECQRPECNGAAFCYRCRGPWNPPSNDLTDPDVECGHVCFRNRSVNAPEGVFVFERLRHLFGLTNTTGATVSAADGPSAAPYGAVGDASSRPVDQSMAASFVRQLSAVGSQPRGTAIPISDPHSSHDALGEADDAKPRTSVDADISRVEINLPGEETGQVKPCPRCKTLLLKLDDGSCNHMSCFICGCEFCWLCLREVRGTHYLGPSGCTFWGRQQWPFRRRLLVMCLTALLAPFLLALLVALAVPGIILGFPIVSVLQHRNAVSESNVHKRRCKSILVFIGALLLSPILAGLAVILGVPLVLIYVYIFMPISLFPTRRSQNTESKPPIDPDIGHTVNWDLVAENTAHNSRSKNNSSRSSSSSKEFIEAVAKTQDASPSRRASASSQSSADDIQGHLLRSGVDASKKRAQSNGKFT